VSFHLMYPFMVPCKSGCAQGSPRGRSGKAGPPGHNYCCRWKPLTEADGVFPERRAASPVSDPVRNLKSAPSAPRNSTTATRNKITAMANSMTRPLDNVAFPPPEPKVGRS
jgi:hypothetical protein